MEEQPNEEVLVQLSEDVTETSTEANRTFNKSKRGDIWVRSDLWQERERLLLGYADMMTKYVALATKESDIMHENARLREVIQNQNSRIAQLEAARLKTEEDVLKLHGFR